MKQILSVILIHLIFVSCNLVEERAPELKVYWELKENLVNELGESEWLIQITNAGNTNLPAEGWSLFFNHIMSLKADSSSGFTVQLVNGDLRVLKPNSSFNGLKVGQSCDIKILSSGSALNISDAPQGFYLVFDTNVEIGIPCDLTIGEFPKFGLNRVKNECLPIFTPQIAYEINNEIKKLNNDEFCPIIPTPKEIVYGDGILILTDSINIVCDNLFLAEAQFLKKKLKKLFFGSVTINEDGEKNIELKYSPNYEGIAEGYGLKIDGLHATIEAGSNKGIFYGIQSMSALMPLENWVNPLNNIKLRQLKISDEPRFEYRGMFLDVARNFQPKDNVLRLLDLMSFYKLNKFHFHICDDEGWRIEISDLPELTEFGGFRGHSPNESKYLFPSFGSGPISSSELSHGSGYYTKSDFIEILTFAAERHIEVIPEIDMPGHARAAIRSMQVRYEKFMQLEEPDKAKEFLLSDCNDESIYRSVQGWNDNVVNVGMESTYAFLEKVTDEILLLFSEANAPLTSIHMGGDEVPSGVWEKSPECDKLINNSGDLEGASDLAGYFVQRFSEILAKRNLKAGGWEEVALTHSKEVKPNTELLGKNIIPYVWNNMWNSGVEDIGYKLANIGYPIVLANVTNLYFDLAYNKNANEPGYYWGNFIDTKKPWEYTPFDLSKCAEFDRFGNRIDRLNLLKNMEALSVQGQSNIMGIQGLLWSENNLGLERMEYFIFPKLFGLAERAWAKQPEWAKTENNIDRVNLREIEWLRFVNTVGHIDLPRLDFYNGGVGYRIPTPGAIIENGILYANTLYPNFDIRYTDDGSEPTLESKLYSKPITVSGNVKLKTYTKNYRSSNLVEINYEQ